MNLRTKISLWYAGLLTLVIVLFSVSIFGVIQATIITSVDSELAQTSSNVIRNARVIPMGEFGALQTSVIFRSDEIFRVPGISIQVWQTHNSESKIEPILIQSSFDLANVTHALDKSSLLSELPIFTNGVSNHVPGRVMTRPFSTAGGQSIGVIQIFTPTLIINQVNDGVLTMMIVTTVAGVVIAIGLGMMLSYRVLRPIGEVTAAATRISTTNDLSTRLPEPLSDDEIGRLTKVFNHMMSRIEYLFGVRQRFVTDLSHELRTPLTAIQGNLDIIERYGADDTSLQAMRIEANRMTRMVNEVLMLARADYGDITIDQYPLDLATLVHERFVSIPALSYAKDRDLDFQLGQHEQVQINGNYERLQQVIDNLLVNAIRFTPDGGTITLSVYSEDNQGILEVKDTGIGIKKDKFERIFERFFQVDASRAHASDEDGAGLGLSIVKWIVGAHGGKIEVDSTIDVGTTFRVMLPLLDTSTSQQYGHAGDHSPPTTLMTQSPQTNGW